MGIVTCRTFIHSLIIMYSAVAAAALLAGSAVAAYSNDTVITTDVTVTDYTTYCPYSTEVVIKTCTLEKCAPVTITVSEAQTLTVTGECVIPTTYTTEWATTTSTVECHECEEKSTVAPVPLLPQRPPPLLNPPLPLSPLSRLVPSRTLPVLWL